MTPRYFHGGPRGLIKLRPPSETGVRSIGHMLAPSIVRNDRVFVTTEFAAAVIYAASHGKGVVYEVEPVGKLEHDPDCSQPGLSFQCPAARIVRVVIPKPNDLKRARKAMLSA